MRIRSKLLSLLLVVVLVPLCSLGWYAWRQTTHLGRDLADGVASELEAIASKELAQSVEMLAENCADTLNVLETSITLIADEAARQLTNPRPGAVGAFHFDTEFDAGIVPRERMVMLPNTEVPCSYDHLVFHLPPELTPKTANKDITALSGTLPVMKTLFTRHKDIMAFGYVGLTSGLHMAYPGHGGYPQGYDPRKRTWFQRSLKAGCITWSVMVEAVTRQVMATMAAPVALPDGPVLGVAGLDIPMGSLFLQSDLSRAFSDRMQTLVFSVKPSELSVDNEPLIIATRSYGSKESKDWTAPVVLARLTSPDRTALGSVVANVMEERGGVQRLMVNGEDSLLAYAPIRGKQLAVALVVPRDVVVAGAVKAESTVLAAVNGLAAQMGWFVAGAVLIVLALSYSASRVVTRPVLELASAAKRLAGGDFEVRASVRGSDELADLARSFNDMAPHLLERIKLKGDMALAMEVQQHLLPHRPPSIKGLDVAAMSLYCDETGGDYFDFLDFSQEDYAHADIVVGDVTGHGIPAALFMASGRALLRGRALDYPGPGVLLSEVNNLLWQDTQLSGRFITLFFLRLDLASKELLWCRAGHDPGLLYDPETGAFENLMGPGIPLGVDPDWEYKENRRPWLKPGQILVLYTDGIHEAADEKEAMYGRDRLKKVVAENADAPASTVVNALMADLKDFKNGLPLEDDVTLVVIKATPEDEEA